LNSYKLDGSVTVRSLVAEQHRPAAVAARVCGPPLCQGHNLGLGQESATPHGPKADPAAASHRIQSNSHLTR